MLVRYAILFVSFIAYALGLLDFSCLAAEGPHYSFMLRLDKKA